MDVSDEDITHSSTSSSRSDDSDFERFNELLLDDGVGESTGESESDSDGETMEDSENSST